MCEEAGEASLGKKENTVEQRGRNAECPLEDTLFLKELSRFLTYINNRILVSYGSGFGA